MSIMNATARPQAESPNTFESSLRLTGLSSAWRLLVNVGAMCALYMSLAGCGYVVGTGYQGDVRSVYVPSFTSQSDRRGLEFQLTEAVQKQIQQRTPFRLVKEPMADTRLTGRILDLRKDVLGETAFDDPRELQLSLVVEVTWEDTRSGQILGQRRVALAPDVTQLNAQADFAPEVGHSLATGLQQAINETARQIVDMMETPW